MKFSYNWIREMVAGLDATPADLVRSITMRTAECEGMEHTGELLARVSTARVLAIEDIPNSHNKKLRWTRNAMATAP